MSSKSHLDRHLMIHRDERPFPCDTCGFAFRFRSDLKRHQLHSCQKNWKCLICGEEFRNKHLLHCHIKKCGNDDGEEPEKQIKRKKKLPEDQEYSYDDDGKTICSICDEKIHPNSIHRHIRDVHKKKRAFKVSIPSLSL